MRIDERAELAGLMHAARAGCRLSFERIYLLTSDRLFGIVLRITRDRVDAEEVLQETYLKVWNWRGRFDEACGPVDLWLAGIAHCSAIDSLRQGRSEWAGSELEPQPVPALSLPSRDRGALALALHDGLSRREIASRLEQPIGTVKAWIRASLGDLRQGRADPR